MNTYGSDYISGYSHRTICPKRKQKQINIINSLGHEMKHARDLIPSINQQVKIGKLLSTLRPNQ